MKRKRERKHYTLRKKIILAVVSVIAAVVLVPVLLFGGSALWMTIASLLPTKPADILNDSNSYILWNNPWKNKLPAPEGWQQIVQDSKFSLGEPQLHKNEYDTWTHWELALPDAAFPNIDGSTVMIPMAAEFARQHFGLAPEHAEEFLSFSTTHYAYDALCRRAEKSYYFRDYFDGVDFTTWETGRPVDLVLGTAPGEEEQVIAIETGVTFAQTPVCWDAFVFITGRDNPVDSLTLAQVRGIFSGEITNWKEFGGANESIRAYQREPGSGSQTGMEQLVMAGILMADPKTVKVVAGMGALVDAVAEYENSSASIGYSYRYYIDNQYSSENIKQLKIEGVAPTDENIISGAYPLSVNYFGVIRQGEEDGPGGQFLDWILSEEGQACVRQAGYIPLAG